MRITIDKHGSIKIPLAVRKKLGLKRGTNLDLTLDDGRITLHPVAINRATRISEQGQAKLNEARTSGTGKLPEWLRRVMKSAGTGKEQRQYLHKSR